jgi:tetratricopeptide (TPR) repeat protein
MEHEKRRKHTTLRGEMEHDDAMLEAFMRRSDMEYADAHRVLGAHNQAIKEAAKREEAHVMESNDLAIAPPVEVRPAELGGAATVGSAEYFHRRAFSNRIRGDLKAAIADYEQAVKLDDKDFRSHFNLGLTYYKMVDYDAALRCFATAKAIQPRNQFVHYNIGTVCLHRKQHSNAIRSFSRAIQLYKEQQAGEISRRAREHEEQTAVFKKKPEPYGADFTANMVELYYKNRALANRKAGRWDDAAEDYQNEVEMRTARQRKLVSRSRNISRPLRETFLIVSLAILCCTGDATENIT